MKILDLHAHTGHASLMRKNIQRLAGYGFNPAFFDKSCQPHGGPTCPLRMAYPWETTGSLTAEWADTFDRGVATPARDKETGLCMAGDERILGSTDPVASVLRQARGEHLKRTDAKATPRRTCYCSCSEIVWEPKRRSSKSTIKERAASQARAINAHLAIDRLRISGAEVARNLEHFYRRYQSSRRQRKTSPLWEIKRSACIWQEMKGYFKCQYVTNVPYFLQLSASFVFFWSSDTVQKASSKAVFVSEKDWQDLYDSKLLHLVKIFTRLF